MLNCSYLKKIRLKPRNNEIRVLIWTRNIYLNSMEAVKMQCCYKFSKAIMPKLGYRNN